jgi:hypothetical protein
MIAYDFINCVTSQTNLLQDADAADKIAVSLKSKILDDVTALPVHPAPTHRVSSPKSPSLLNASH